jgi:nucleoside-diphosphate-sugar epimerase
MSKVNKVLVTGSSGYVANYIMKQLATSHPEIQVLGMSRSGIAREDYMRSLKNVKYL